MKYPNWGEYDNAKKWKAVADEVNLETNNATTKADLTNMVKFLAYEVAHLQAAVYKAEAEVERLKEEAHQDIEWLYKEYVLEADVNLSQDAIDLKRKLRDMVCKELQAENAKLRAVVDAARVYVMEHDKTPNLRTLDEWIIIVAAIRNALAELDKEGDE